MTARNLSFALATAAILSVPAAAAPPPLYFTAPPAAPAAPAADAPPVAETAPPETDTRLAACLERARLDPPAARAAAESWVGEGGGAPAELCIAMAAFHGGAFAEAAGRLEKLAGLRPPEEAAAAARLLAQAGWAWLRAGKPDLAEQRYSEALGKRSDDVDLWIDRAFARAEAERYWDAIDDLEQAMRLAPDRVEPLLYRAAAHQALGQTRPALADLARALEMRPDEPQAFLLRGRIRAEAGDLAGAAADWEQTVRLEPADGPNARAAAAHLEKLRRGPPK